MPLINLPRELILEVAAFLDSNHNLNICIWTCRRLYGVLNPYLYHQNKNHGGSLALWWALPRAQLDTVWRALAYSADLNNATFKEARNTWTPPATRMLAHTIDYLHTCSSQPDVHTLFQLLIKNAEKSSA